MGIFQLSRYLSQKKEKPAVLKGYIFPAGSDEKIYRERIALGYHLAKGFLKQLTMILKTLFFPSYQILQKLRFTVCLKEQKII